MIWIEGPWASLGYKVKLLHDVVQLSDHVKIEQYVSRHMYIAQGTWYKNNLFTFTKISEFTRRWFILIICDSFVA